MPHPLRLASYEKWCHSKRLPAPTTRSMLRYSESVWEQGEESCLRRFRFRFLDTSVSDALADGGGRKSVQVCYIAKLVDLSSCAYM